MVIRGPENLKLNRDKFPPKWFIKKLNEAFPEEVRNYFRMDMYRTVKRTRLIGRSEGWCFLHNYLRRSFRCKSIGMLDHGGTDKEGNFVTEPYAGDCDECKADIQWLAEKLQCKFSINQETWWAPHIKHCIRVTFYKGEEK